MNLKQAKKEFLELYKKKKEAEKDMESKLEILKLALQGIDKYAKDYPSIDFDAIEAEEEYYKKAIRATRAYGRYIKLWRKNNAKNKRE